jgi:hypothetical protein
VLPVPAGSSGKEDKYGFFENSCRQCHRIALPAYEKP